MYLAASPDAWDRLWAIPDEILTCPPPDASKRVVVRRVAPTFSSDLSHHVTTKAGTTKVGSSAKNVGLESTSAAKSASPDLVARCEDKYNDGRTSTVEQHPMQEASAYVYGSAECFGQMLACSGAQPCSPAFNERRPPAPTSSINSSLPSQRSIHSSPERAASFTQPYSAGTATNVPAEVAASSDSGADTLPMLPHVYMPVPDCDLDKGTQLGDRKGPAYLNAIATAAILVARGPVQGFSSRSPSDGTEPVGSSESLPQPGSDPHQIVVDADATSPSRLRGPPRQVPVAGASDPRREWEPAAEAFAPQTMRLEAAALGAAGAAWPPTAPPVRAQPAAADGSDADTSSEVAAAVPAVGPCAPVATLARVESAAASQITTAVPASADPSGPTLISTASWDSDALRRLCRSRDPRVNALPPQQPRQPQSLPPQPQQPQQQPAVWELADVGRPGPVCGDAPPRVSGPRTEACTTVRPDECDTVAASAVPAAGAADTAGSASTVVLGRASLPEPHQQHQEQQQKHLRPPLPPVRRGPRTTSARLLMRVRQKVAPPAGAAAIAGNAVPAPARARGLDSSTPAATSAFKRRGSHDAVAWWTEASTRRVRTLGVDTVHSSSGGEEASNDESESARTSESELSPARRRRTKPTRTVAAAAAAGAKHGPGRTSTTLLDEVRRALAAAAAMDASDGCAAMGPKPRTAWRLPLLRGRFDFRTTRRPRSGAAGGSAAGAAAASRGGGDRGAVAGESRDSGLTGRRRSDGGRGEEELLLSGGDEAVQSTAVLRCRADEGEGAIVAGHKRRSPSAPSPLLPPPPPRGDGSPALNLLQALDEWRSERARTVRKTPESLVRLGLLADVAARCPTSVLQLEDVPGLPRPFIRRFGQEVLDVCRNHAHLRSARAAAVAAARARHAAAVVPPAAAGFVGEEMGRQEDGWVSRERGWAVAGAGARQTGCAKRSRLLSERTAGGSTARADAEAQLQRSQERQGDHLRGGRAAAEFGGKAQDGGGGGDGCGSAVQRGNAADGPAGHCAELEASRTARLRQRLLGILGMQTSGGETGSAGEPQPRAAAIFSARNASGGCGGGSGGGAGYFIARGWCPPSPGREPAAGAAGRHGGCCSDGDVPLPCKPSASDASPQRPRPFAPMSAAAEGEALGDVGVHNAGRNSVSGSGSGMEESGPKPGVTKGPSAPSFATAVGGVGVEADVAAHVHSAPFEPTASDVSASDAATATPDDAAAAAGMDTQPQPAAAGAQVMVAADRPPVSRKRAGSNKSAPAQKISAGQARKRSQGDSPRKAAAEVAASAAPAAGLSGDLPAGWVPVPAGLRARCGSRLAYASTPSLGGAKLKCLLGILAEAGTAAAAFQDAEAGAAGRAAADGGECAAAAAAAPLPSPDADTPPAAAVATTSLAPTAAVLPAAAVAVATMAQRLGRSAGQFHIRRLRAMAEAAMPAWEVRRVLACTALSPAAQASAVLRLEPGASRDSVRLAFRRLSLLVHPDKNRSPGAAEAFALVSAAASKLLGGARH